MTSAPRKMTGCWKTEGLERMETDPLVRRPGNRSGAFRDLRTSDEEPGRC